MPEHYITSSKHVQPDSFLKILATRLCALTLILSVLILILVPAMSQGCDVAVKHHVTELGLNLTQLTDLNMANSAMKISSNIALAKTKNAIENVPGLSKASLSVYDLSNQELIANSFEIAIIENEAVVAWWQECSGRTEGLPPVSLDKCFEEFCRRFDDDTVYINELYCLNGVLFPAMVSVYNKDGEILEQQTSATPSVSDTYECAEQEVILQLIGNSINDKIYGKMMNFEIVVPKENDIETKNDTSSTSTEDLNIYKDLNGSGEEQAASIDPSSIAIKYPLITNEDGKLLSLQFLINGSLYQVDCGYQTNIWGYILPYVLLSEVAIVLVSAAWAFITYRKQQ